MGFWSKMENFIESKVNSLTGRAYNDDLQPVEIAKMLLKVLEENKNVGISQIYVPNKYIVGVNQRSYQNMKGYGAIISKELATALAEHIKENNYVVDGELEVVLCEAKAENKKRFNVVAEFTNENIVKETNENESSGFTVDDNGNTIVFARVDASQTEHCIAELLVLEGMEKGQKLKIGRERVNIGRLERNEFTVIDGDVSRLHAYVVLENDRHVLYDAQSLNGTYVNEQKILRKELEKGDRIRIGSTVVVYG